MTNASADIEDGCLIERFNVPSPSMEREIRAVAVLPPAYENEPDRRFPVLYTLHGRGAPYDTWAQMSPLRQALHDMPMVVICLDGDDASMYIDSTLLPDSQFTTFFFEEFVPAVDARYRIDTLRRAEVRLSSAGHKPEHVRYRKKRPPFSGGLFGRVKQNAELSPPAPSPGRPEHAKEASAKQSQARRLRDGFVLKIIKGSVLRAVDRIPISRYPRDG